MIRTISLARRLMLTLVITSVVITTCMVVIVHHLFQEQIKTTLINKAQVTLDYLAGSLAVPIWNLSDDTVQQIARTTAQDETIGMIEIIDIGRKRVLYSKQKEDGKHLIQAFRIVEHEGFKVGEVRIGLSAQHFDKQLGAWIKYLLFVAIIVIVLSALLMTVLLRHFLRTPFVELKAIVEAYGSGGYAFKPEVRYKEFQPFGRVLEDMGRKILEQFQQLKDINSALQIDEARLNAMLALSEATAQMSERDLIQHGIEEAQNLTGSGIGYLHFINDDQETIELKTWSRDTLKICTAAYDSHYSVTKAGIWADTVRFKHPVVHNDYQTSENRRGLPEGHFPLVRHMAVPVIESGQVKMIVGVGNKPTNYDDSDLRQLQLIGDTIWKIISLRRAMTKLENARDAAEAANVAKSAFLANMSHEMRTPLNHISGMAGLIRREPLSPKQLDRMDKLDAACRNLTTLIETVLELTKIEAGKFDIAEEPLNIKELMDEVVSGLQESAAAKQLQLITKISHVSTGLAGDKGLVRRALLNYVSNAIRFTESGSVTVFAKLIEENELSALVRFEVQDSGIGIAPEDLPRLFSVFEQVDNSSTRKFGGLGVGLAMTKKLAVIMGGEAGCESSLGEGSTFWFTVRLKKY